VGEKFTQNENENELIPGEKLLELEATRLAPPEPGKARAVFILPAEKVTGLP
jgi:hypothetical protein